MKVSVCNKFWSFNQEPLVCDFFVVEYEIYAHICRVIELLVCLPTKESSNSRSERGFSALCHRD